MFLRINFHFLFALNIFQHLLLQQVSSLPDLSDSTILDGLSPFICLNIVKQAANTSFSSPIHLTNPKSWELISMAHDTTSEDLAHSLSRLNSSSNRFQRLGVTILHANFVSTHQMDIITIGALQNWPKLKLLSFSPFFIKLKLHLGSFEPTKWVFGWQCSQLIRLCHNHRDWDGTN